MHDDAWLQEESEWDEIEQRWSTVILPVILSVIRDLADIGVY